jgi:MoaA/NifB/PqqE/SkfB family radical SAM enzyme
MVPIRQFARAALGGGGHNPLYVVFFVTERCNANCGHCLLGHWRRAEEELTLDEIERWARKMPEFFFLLPTGGEPFLRPDLPDIVRLFTKHCGVRNAGVPTNGLLTERIVESVGRILAENPSLEFAVDVSIDGIGGDHDRIRGVPGLFDRATATIRALQRIAEKDTRFNINAALPVSALNQHNLGPTLDYIVRELRIGNVNQLLARGRPRTAAALEVDPRNYSALNRRLEQYILDGALSGYSGYDIAGGVNALKIVRQRTIEKTIAAGRPLVACRAGRLGAVVRADGAVFPCELLNDRIGGLRDSDFDFMSLWRSDAARAVRRKIRDTNCFCTYECFMTLNVLFDPLKSLEIARRWAELKMRKR